MPFNVGDIVTPIVPLVADGVAYTPGERFEVGFVTTPDIWFNANDPQGHYGSFRTADFQLLAPEVDMPRFTVGQLVTPIAPTSSGVMPGDLCIVRYVTRGSNQSIEYDAPNGVYGAGNCRDFAPFDLSTIVRSERYPYIAGDVLEVTKNEPDGAGLRPGQRVTVKYMPNQYQIVVDDGYDWIVSICHLESRTEGVPTVYAPVMVGDIVEIIAHNANGATVSVGDTATVRSVNYSTSGGNRPNAHCRMTASGRDYNFYIGRDFRVLEPRDHGITDPNPIEVGSWVVGADDTPQRVTSVNGAYVRVLDRVWGPLFTEWKQIEDLYPVHPGDKVMLFGGYDEWEVETVDGTDIFLRSELNPGLYLDQPVKVDDLSIIPRPEPVKPRSYYVNTDSDPRPGDIVRAGLSLGQIYANSVGSDDPLANLAVNIMSDSGSRLAHTLTDYGHSFHKGSEHERTLLVRDGLPFVDSSTLKDSAS